jgi:serine/threonine protein kinase/tetratricopeptide (TPR) repeat protein
MVCPRCGGTTIAASVAGVCPACGASLTGSPSMPDSSLDDGATRLQGTSTSPPGPGAFGDESTGGFGPPKPSDAATVLAGPETLARESAVRSASPSEEGPLAVGQAFGTRYHIIRLLGVGGMGAVYQAWDAELGVAVAIKVIRPEVMADPVSGAEIEKRFKRELLLARQVTHKNVVRIHDLGTIGGIKYITMPYVEGADLATILRNEGRLPPTRALRIARSVVAGLTEAHKKDVIHRDLKPANIMIDAQDEALIMDFGIARSTGAPVGGPMPGNTTIVGDLQRISVTPDATVLGAVVGTVEYMAPEQARGQHVDQRADVYAFGLIMYDMLVARPRAQGAGGAIGELQSRMVQAPPAAKAFVPDIPVALDAVVSRCLDPDPAKRFQTSAELAEALHRLDEKGNPVRIKRVVGLRASAGVLTLVVAALGTTWWFTRGAAVPEEHEPVSVLIADFQNSSNDPTFDRTLEPVLKLALESAGFISAYDRGGMRPLGVRPPDTMDERTAQEIAVKQGLGVVVSGSVARAGSGYEIAVKATQAVTGTVLASKSRRASSKDQALNVITRLATEVREALGDDTSDDTKRFANQTLSATSLDVVRHYAAAMGAMSNGKFEDALRSYEKAVELDPKFGIGYQGMAVASRGLDRQQDAEKYIKKALEQVDGMTERERYRTRALYYGITGDFQNCVNEYGQLVAKYAADASARNNLAVCSNFLRDTKRAVEEEREVIKILPKRPLYHINLALHAAYAGDFETAESEARVAQTLGGAVGLQPLALAQLGKGNLTQTAETYQAMGKSEELGESYMASGLGDLAIFEGRFSDAIRILQAGAAADVAAKESDKAAAKFAALAYAQLARGQKRAAADAAEAALKNSSTVKIRFLAARTFIEVGESAKGRALAAGLASELQPEPQSYGKLIEGEIALKDKNPREAIKLFLEAKTLLNTWISRFDLGRAYLEAGAYPQADSEFDQCINRRGEALSLFLDEEPTWGYLPPVYYYQGRVREGLKTAGFAESYRAYLDIRGKAGEDPLLPEVRRRAGN